MVMPVMKLANISLMRLEWTRADCMKKPFVFFIMKPRRFEARMAPYC